MLNHVAVPALRKELTLLCALALTGLLPGCGDEPCTQCGDGCYDLKTDYYHCGSCDKKCSPGQVCNDGTCTSTSGSCPFAFVEEQGRYRYAGDLSGSPLAAGLTFFRPEHYGVNVYALGGWSAAEGWFRLRLRELAFEASYLDLVTLVLVDLPAGHGVHNEWSSTPQLDREPARRYLTVRDPRPPRSATTPGGQDVLAAVSTADGVPLPVEERLSRVIVDFGPVAHPERARLVVTTWGAYADWRDEAAPPPSAGTSIETLDPAGQWQERVLAGKSASDAKTWVIDIAGVLAAGDGRLRITMAHQQSTIDVLDAVLLDDSEQVPFTLTRLEPTTAVLSAGQASPMLAPTLDHRAIVEDRNIPPMKEAFLSGRYTRYGDVRPLLRTADDRFAIMAHADELLLEFSAPPLPPQSTRRVFLEADLFYTLKFHPFGKLTDTIEPLPYHGMRGYPYPAEQWPYRDDADYARYLEEWNTRSIVVPGP